jgi:hypothetical protein
MGKIMPDLVAAIKNIISNITQNTLEKLSWLFIKKLNFAQSAHFGNIYH